MLSHKGAFRGERLKDGYLENLKISWGQSPTTRQPVAPRPRDSTHGEFWRLQAVRKDMRERFRGSCQRKMQF